MAPGAGFDDMAGPAPLDKGTCAAALRLSARPISRNKGIIVANSELVITPISRKTGRAAFVDCAYRLNAADQNWVPNLRSEEIAKFTPGKNPYFEHARSQLFLRSEEHTSELQSLMRISYDVFYLKKTTIKLVQHTAIDNYNSKTPQIRK